MQLDFVDTFDSLRMQTAFVRTLREGYPDPYQVPVVEPPGETLLIEAEVSSVSLVFGQTDDDAVTYRIRLVAGACDGGRAEYPYRVAQVSRPDTSSKARHGTDPFHVQGQSPGFVLLKCGTSTSPGPWREVAVQASPLYRYPLEHKGKNQNQAVVLLSAPFGERVVHAVYNPHWQTWGDYLCETDDNNNILWNTCDGEYGGSAYRLAERQAPVTLRVDATRLPEKTPANLRFETADCATWQACPAWDAVADATGYQVQWRFLNQGWDSRYRQALVDGASHDFDAAATAEMRMRVRAYSTDFRYSWVGPWREATREPLSPPAGLPVIAIGSASAKESGDGKTVTMTFPVTLDRRVDGEVTVDWETVDGTALAGEDYQAASGTVTFSAEETRQTITVTILDDDLPDTGETFTVLLSNPAGPGDGAVLGNARATGRIRNHESDLILTGITLVDASDQSVLAALADGATVTLADPEGGSFAIRADAAAEADIGSVRLELSGAKTASRTDNEAPWSLYGDAEGTLVGEALPAGSYTLRAKAYAEADLGGNVLHTLAISFTGEGPVEETAALLSATFPASPFASRSHSGPTDRPQVVVAFSEPVESFAADTGSVSVSGASVHGVQALAADGLENAVVFFLTPAGNGTIGFRLVADVACAGGGICTADGRGLAQVPETHTIPGQEAENTPAAGSPAVSGTARVGQILTADTSGITDEDGLTGVSYGYQWIRSDGNTDTDIQDATGSTYTPPVSDVGQTIKVRVSFTDDANNQESLTSEATTAVAATVPTQPLSLTVTKGSQIEELDASWQAPASDGGSAVTGYKVQWKEAADSWDTEADVSEETVTGTTYTFTGLTGGEEYAVRVLATNEVGDGPASAEAAGTPAGGSSEQNTEPENSEPTGLPTISGTAQAGQVLTADTTGIDDADGLTNVSYSYQWIRSDGGTDTDIQDATGSTYELTDDDEGKTIKVRVSFTDDADNQETLTSAATAAVEARPNSPATGAPTISGTAQVGETLTADTAGIDDTDGLAGVSYSYQWIRSDGGTDTDIDGETASTYTVSDEDVGKTIMVRVSFTDEAGHAESLVSQATSAVAAAPSPLTASIHDEPQSHDGENVFTFELRFSEELKPGFSFKTLRDHAFTVTGGDITRAKRVDGSGNLRFIIHVQPDGSGGVTVVLPVTTDCEAEHAICTEDGRPLSNRLELTVSGPDG